MKYIFLVLSLISISAHSNDIKEMECIEFSVNTDKSGFREVVNKFEIKSSVNLKKLDIYVQNKKDKFGKQWQGFEKWNLIYSGESNNRVTGYSIRKINTSSLESPLVVIDIDFSKPKIKITNFGGHTDFDTIISEPSTIECARK
jgi:hypothetical protein